MSPMTTGGLIAAGGEGAVYEDAQDGAMVIKALHPQFATPDRAAKLRAMCDNPPANWQTLGWPVAVEADASGIRYRMPRAPQSAATAYRFISANERRRLPGICQSYEYRAKVGVNIAEALRGLHATHVRIGDVNPSNILVDGNGAVTLIDCDSFQIPGPPGHQPYPCVVGSPEYTAPEIDDFRRQFRSQDSDNFALAVLLYQLLGNGSHPYQGIDASPQDAVSNIRERIKQHRFAHQPAGSRWRPTPGQMRSWQAMPEQVRDAFRQAFSPGASQIGRPTADAWVIILTDNPAALPVPTLQPAGSRGNTPMTPPAWQVGNTTLPAQPGTMPRQSAGTLAPGRPGLRPNPQRPQVAGQFPAGQTGQLYPPFRFPASRRQLSLIAYRFFRQAALNWRVSIPAAAVGLLLAWVFSETGGDLTFDTLGTQQAAPAPAVISTAPTPAALAGSPDSPTGADTTTAGVAEPGPDSAAVAPLIPLPGAATPTPVPTTTPLSTATPIPTATATPTLVPTPSPIPEPVPALLPMAIPTPEPTPTPLPGSLSQPTLTPVGPEASVLPEGGSPGTDASIYGQGFEPSAPVSRVSIGGIDITPSPKPVADESGNLYFNILIPGVDGGLQIIEVQVGKETAATSFHVLVTPTPPPTITPTPAPTRVPRALQHARHSDAHYTVNVPTGWPGGRVTFFARAYSGPPGPWVQANTIRGATRYEIKSLKDAGVNLVGTYFKERYSSEELCGARGFVTIRESALVTHYPGTGIALHVDVCEADLPLESEAGLTNEDVSHEIIRSLQKQN